MQINIAIIEDEPVFLHQFQQALALEPGMNVVATATDFASGLALLSQRPAPDVLLVDLGLPGGSGIDVIRQASVRWPACEIMVVSMFGDQQNVMAALQAGATGYLLKDSRPEKLSEQVRALKNGGSPISPVIARMLLTQLPSFDGPPRAAAPQPSASCLTEKEREVLQLAAKGYSYKEVADKLCITPNTVATHIKRVFDKLHVNSKSEAVYEARRSGFIE